MTPKSDNTFDFWPSMQKKYGDFYCFGYPGLGAGLNGHLYVIQDPVEMAKLIRQEGKFPNGAAEFSWGMKKFFEDRNLEAQHFFSRGPEWKRVRTFIQSDLLSVAASEAFLPAIIEAAKYSAKGASAYKDNLNEYSNHASFDMFSNVILGKCPRVTDPTVPTDPQDVEFCDTVASALRGSSKLMQSGHDIFWTKLLGIETNEYKEFAQNWDKAYQFSAEKTSSLLAKSMEDMSEMEKNSYTIAAKNRVESKGSTLTLKEAESISQGLIAAGVDTTGNNLNWKLLHLGLSPEAQERIYQEQLALSGGDPENVTITPESVVKENAPFLHACIRESHRLANPAPSVPRKKFFKPISVHGIDLPAGTVLVLDGYSAGVNKEVVGEDAMDYKPERFLKDAVEKRKGTKSQIIDHAFFKGPFSQGARKCPGSRVANLETAALLAAICVEWEFTFPGVKHWTDVPYGLETLTTCYLPAGEFKPRRKP